jgi:hypothetical protein
MISGDLLTSHFEESLVSISFSLVGLSDFKGDLELGNLNVTTNQNKQSCSFLHTFLLSPLMDGSLFELLSVVVASNESSNYGERL